MVDGVCKSHEGRRGVSPSGFTLVELLVVIAIIGLLVGLLLPAVHAARESARRTQCVNNLKNQSLAVLNFESHRKLLPPGHMLIREVEYGWSFYILPWLEQSTLYNHFDQAQPWDVGPNLPFTRRSLGVYRCPSGQKDRDGDIDYGGIKGSVIGAKSGDPFNRGALIVVTAKSPTIRLSQVTDGLSHTVCISENTDRELPDGVWGAGLNCISHDVGRINSNIDGIRSYHGSGANAARLDGSVIYLSSGVDEKLLAALLTRNGGEISSWEVD
jgi:prepilin-type N-terminal cleavage/methylation domain-containing protein/prepilin-type processing-associated H-X9-DG protein